MKTCKKCDLSYDDDKKFCKICGEPLTQIRRIDEIINVNENVFEERTKTDSLKVELSNKKPRNNKKHKRIIIASLSGFIIIIFSIFAFKVLLENKKIVKDFDGNIYHTVKIGTQVWMVENLKVTHYRNGDAIPDINFSAESNWTKLNSGAYCNFASSSPTYGHLYNWYAVNDSRNIAPKGWHVPTAEEWNTLINFLGGFKEAGGKLKENGTSFWKNSNIGATDKYGFKALPSGYRVDDISYSDEGLEGIWWSSTSYNNSQAIFFNVESISAKIFSKEVIKTVGFSVRCIKD